MQKIRLSKALVEAYKNIGVNISYALSELLGYIDWDHSSQIYSPSVVQRDTIEITIEDAVYRDLQDKFDKLASYDEVAEMLLWSNYLMGGNL